MGIDFELLARLEISASPSNVDNLNMRDVYLSLPSDEKFQYYSAHDCHESLYVNECFSDEYFSILHCNIWQLILTNFELCLQDLV